MWISSFPAVLIGGPPDSGKSVLITSLSLALRQRQVQHYVLRACPDGEGDWTQWADQNLVRTILVPHAWTPEWVTRMCRDLENRHLPLLVDVGGRPKPWQEAIFDCCTHAILLTPDQIAHAHWLELMSRHRVSVLADLRTAPEGEGCVKEEQPVLRGAIAGLQRGTMAGGPAFDALLECLVALFDYPQADLRQRHLDAAPAEITLELDRLKRTLDIGGDPDVWTPASLPRVLDYLPEHTPLALYGRAPNWLYAALALLAYPAELALFDVRLGWVKPPHIALATPAGGKALHARVNPYADYVRVEFSLPEAFIDYLDADAFQTPGLPSGCGVVVGGKLPHWLLTGIVLAYHDAPWIAVYQPIAGGAVVVSSRSGPYTLGQILPVSAP